MAWQIKALGRASNTTIDLQLSCKEQFLTTVPNDPNRSICTSVESSVPAPHASCVAMPDKFDVEPASVPSNLQEPKLTCHSANESGCTRLTHCDLDQPLGIGVSGPSCSACSTTMLPKNDFAGPESYSLSVSPARTWLIVCMIRGASYDLFAPT